MTGANRSLNVVNGELLGYDEHRHKAFATVGNRCACMTCSK
jgi:hypothetical protein